MRTIFVGDIHGCAVEFADLLFKLAYEKDTDRIFLTGDAFTRGPDPHGVWRQIKGTEARMVMGNHDHKLFLRLRRRLKGGDETTLRPERKAVLDALMPVARHVYKWLKTVPFWIEEEEWLLVHAGINPDRGLAGTTPHEFMKIRTWPLGADLSGPRWHDHYSGEKTIIFGHDAPAGLVIKKKPDGRPLLLGLDTACVFGKELTAYIWEEDRIVQVPSRKKARARRPASP
ncbi:MAG: metallophosphoesterase [Planctomycetes bacterium]|nr:metallophosphoesterase [Planctomycetota bacterium]